MRARTIAFAVTCGLVLTSCGIKPAVGTPGYVTTIPLSGLVTWPTAPVPPSPEVESCGPPVTTSILLENAYGSDWSKAAGLIALNKIGADGRYHIFTMKPDGTDLEQIGVGSSTFPQKTTGSPSWSPDGKFIAFAAEDAVHSGNSVEATPGWGGYSNLWVSTANGSKAWQLTFLPNGENDRLLLPQFSPNGKLLEWTQGTPGGNSAFGKSSWVIKVARFAVSATGVPSISDVQTIDPGGIFKNEFIETGGFSSNSVDMLFASDFQGHVWADDQIYDVDLASGAISRITTGDYYNEHPRYTPSGQVIYMTDRDQPKSHAIGDDWWIVNADGTDPHRLTAYNNPQSPEFFGQTVYATVVDTESWAPDGSYFYGDLELQLVTAKSDIVKVSLTCS